jgi:Zn-dependent protease
VEVDSPLRRLRRLEEEERAWRAGAAPTAEAPKRAQPRKRGALAAIGAALVFLATKAKLILAAVKFGALFQTLSTLALSAWIYAGFYGAPLAIGLVLLILVHEYGHGIAARVVGQRVGAPIFIPFFGAVIALKDQPRSTWVEAVVGFGGPLAGTLGGLAVLCTGLTLESEHWRGLLVVIAWITFQLNLFNLMPVFGLDGDRVSQPFRPWHWIPGCLLLLGAGVVGAQVTGRFHPFVAFILVLGAFKGARLAWKARRERSGAARESALDRVTRPERYVEEADVEEWQRTTAACAYFALAIALSALMMWSQANAPSVKS